MRTNRVRQWIYNNASQLTFISIVIVVFIVCACYAAYNDKVREDARYAGYPATAQYSTLDAGQGRFSWEATNLDDVIVLVDHSNGVSYIATVGGITPLLSADGTVAELDAEVGE